MSNRKIIRFIVFIIFLFGLMSPFLGAEDTKTSADERYLEKVYHSKLDNTLQPYIVKLPQNYDKRKKYPLIVYLHGSGGDEKAIYKVPYFFPDEFFGLSVNGRGPATDYCYNNAQDDIAEAIAEVVKDYSIDQENIILSGTSMGGFGVYRTFFETPEKFKAIASFSGLPKGKIAGPEQPNFLKAQYLKNFKNLYIFIFHQVHDPLCPYEMVEKSVKIFQENGAIVEFYPENTKGHGNPSPETIKEYHQWLRKVIKQQKHQNNWKYQKIKSNK
jgi:predicted esterase